MVAAGVKPNRVTYSSLMQAFSRAGQPSAVERLISEMLANRLQPDERTLTALLLAHAHAPKEQRSPAQAAMSFRQLVARGAHVDSHVADALSRAIGRDSAAALLSELAIAVDGNVSQSNTKRTRSGGDASGGSMAERRRSTAA